MLSKPSGPTSKATKNEKNNFATVGLSHDLTRTKPDDSKKKTASLSFVRFLPFRCFEEKRRNELFDEKQRIEKIVSVEHKKTFSDSGDVTSAGKSTQRSKKASDSKHHFFHPKSFLDSKEMIYQKKNVAQNFLESQKQMFSTRPRVNNRSVVPWFKSSLKLF